MSQNTTTGPRGSFPKSFEETLRGKYKNMFSPEPSGRSTVTTPAPPVTSQTADIEVEATTKIQQPAPDGTHPTDKELPVSPPRNEIMEPAIANDRKGKGKAVNFQQDDAEIDGDAEFVKRDRRHEGEIPGTSENKETGDLNQDDAEKVEDEFAEYVETDGDPPREDGWHSLPFFHGPRNTVLLEDKDFCLLKGGAKGTRGPEGYIWAGRPEHLLWGTWQKYVSTRLSISQLRLLDTDGVFLLFKKGEDAYEAHPISKLPGGPLQAIELNYGKPTIVPHIPYIQDDLFLINLTGIDRLNVYVPFHELPLTLDVFDEDDVTNPATYVVGDQESPTYDRAIKIGIKAIQVPSHSKPLRYRLVDPTESHATDRRPEQATHATLVISKSRQIGVGNSARVYEGQIGLEIMDKCVDPKLSPRKRFPSKLRVVAKVSTGSLGTEFLRNEASMYHSFPEYFSREYTGFQLVPPSDFPRRLSQIVPCFYGFYEPVQEDIVGNCHKRAPIILMEDCGMPIDQNILTQNQKAEIFSLIHRMHDAGFVHHSVAPRNILMQPGAPDLLDPLSNCPEWARSMKTPSFRMIDFGRSKKVSNTRSNVPGNGEEEPDRAREFRQARIREDLEQLQHAVRMRPHLFG